MTACDHQWARAERHHTRGVFEGLTCGPLVCVRCEAPWPGYQLPERPAHHIESVGLAEHTSWRSRVRAALDSIDPEPIPAADWRLR